MLSCLHVLILFDPLYLLKKSKPVRWSWLHKVTVLATAKAWCSTHCSASSKPIAWSTPT